MSLSASIKRRYEGMYSGVFYDRYIRGLWIVAEGLIYTCFNPKLHVVPAQERAYDKYYISCDYGTINPTSMGLWGRVGGKWYRIAEYYFDSRREKRQQTDAEYYEQLCKLAGDRKIHAVIVDPSAASFIETIRRGGRFRVEPASNAVLDGIRGRVHAVAARQPVHKRLLPGLHTGVWALPLGRKGGKRQAPQDRRSQHGRFTLFCAYGVCTAAFQLLGR